MSEIKINLDTLAPICVSVYNRYKHFKNCIESLAANDLAKHSVLYIFSDAAKPGDEKAVSKVRQYAKSIKGFKKINLIFQKKKNIDKNIKNFELVLKLNNKCLFLEDDVIVQKCFLKFMNLALNIYEKDDYIFCIGGFVDSANHLEKINDVQALQLLNGSGVGFWKKKYFEYIDDLKLLHPWLRYKKNIFKLIKCIFYFGVPVNMHIRRTFYKNLNDGDVLITEYVYRRKKIILIPPFTLTLNKGHDGTGYNCIKSNEFQNEKFLRKSNKFIFPLHFDKRLVHINTQRYLKSRNLKPNFFRQFYYLIINYYRPPNIIINIFKRLGF